VAAAVEAVAAARETKLGAGLSLRRPHVADALAHGESVDLLEIVADHYFAPERRDELAMLKERFTLVPHGLDLSLGSAAGLPQDYLRDLAALIAAIEPPYWSEHVAFTRAGERRIGHLAPVPFTREALDAFVRNVACVRKSIDRPLILENIACPFDLPYAEYTEAEFLTLLVERTGCGLLLDVANLYYNALNRGQDPSECLAGYPLEAVVQCHLAGGHRAADEWVDSHAENVPEPVWELFGEVARRVPLRAVIVERDEHLPAFLDLTREVARARAILRGTNE
jgi:uncharacterized protein (UPF0276 family)